MDRVKLTETLGIVSEALANNNLVPIFQCFCFKDGMVHAYNEQLAITAPVDVKDTFAVHGRTLLGLLQAGSTDEVELETEGQDLWVTCGKSQMQLPFFPEENFIFEIPLIEVNEAVLLEDHVRMGLETCLTTASKDQTQAAIMGVSYGVKFFYSCDGDAITRVMRNTGEWPKDIEPSPDPLLPITFCETLLKIPVGDVTKDQIEVGGGWARATVGNLSIYGRLTNNSNPFDYEGMLQKTLKGKPTYVPTTTALDYALRRARVVADPVSAKTTLMVQGNKLRLLTETAMGTIDDVIPFKHPDVTAHVSAEKVQRALGVCAEMAIMENCTVYRNGGTVLQLLANMR